MHGRLSLVVASVAITLAALVSVGAAWRAGHAPPPAEPAPAPPAAPEPAPAAVAEAEEPTNPLLDPQATLLPDELLARRLTDEEKAAMAAELDRLKTRHAAELVSVISSAAHDEPSPIPPSFLLSIAFAETRGKVLAVSPAGAAGLAQATPAAYLMEGLAGPLFLTDQYLIGTRAYIMKKPLGDAVAIAGRVIDGRATRAEALDLVAKAKELRRVGVDELEVLAPRAPEVFLPRVEAADRYNEEILDELDGLLSRGASRAALTTFRDRVQKEYRALLRVQQANWERYAAALERERDGVLRRHFGGDPARVLLLRPYEAGEVLGEHLDARFSPTQMAAFLRAHALTKRRQAIDLGVPDDEIEAWTAALYNGGLVNVTRIRAGLIPPVRETETYMRKVPEMRERLEGVAPAATVDGAQ